VLLAALLLLAFVVVVVVELLPGVPLVSGKDPPEEERRLGLVSVVRGTACADIVRRKQAEPRTLRWPTAFHNKVQKL
jgi:hypothetical protein